MSTYERTIRLRHDEAAAKVNKRTGEFMEVAKRPNNIPDDKELFEPNAKFTKCYKRTWGFLKTILNDTEYRIVHEMSMMAKPRTNSLEPLNNATSLSYLADKFSISKTTAFRIFTKLKGIGVYAEISVEEDFEEKNFWILNPYISFNSRVVPAIYVEIFGNTTIGKQFKD